MKFNAQSRASDEVCIYYCGYGVGVSNLSAAKPDSSHEWFTDPPLTGERCSLSLEEQVSRVERRIIEDSLRRHNYRRSETARELGISRVTLYNKMKKFGMLS